MICPIHNDTIKSLTVQRLQLQKQEVIIQNETISSYEKKLHVQFTTAPFIALSLVKNDGDVYVLIKKTYGLQLQKQEVIIRIKQFQA